MDNFPVSYKKKTLLFVYNFPHNKSVDFIYKCIKENIFINVIVGCDYIKIKKPKKVIDVYRSDLPSEHPKSVAKKFKIPYFSCSHNGNKIQSIIKSYKINFGIIAGSRIIKKNIIQLFPLGILNLHPGILPDCRGLDSILWSIYNKNKLGVSAHLIDDKIDSGRLVIKKIFAPSQNDTIFDIYQNVYKLQLQLLSISYNLIQENSEYKFLEKGPYNTYMSTKKQLTVLENVTTYIKNYSNI